ncbi:hypothetical protein OKA04_05660 [Luteolibacter flavescens]|uniref:Ig-like domain-containing protein n=1 Tax=Luteolibacter flavescens TaxID=1859460 RepID=A0ABT3FKV4_9BACT|nr:hypothetical protein [Luteolibacter flavescens]MCW1884208.1 hypothetical protein [Luteolibacter flavescens]
MKSTLLKTLAATTLVATTQAEIHVLGTSWKERGVNAPEGTMIRTPGTIAATRGYLIMDQSVLTATPAAATYIEYGEIREAGVVTRYYTTDTDFTSFLADLISGDSGGRRLYGHMEVPVSLASPVNPMMPFSGTSMASGFPRKISFDQTVFQTATSNTVAGPRIVNADNFVLRSVLTGSGNPVTTKALTISEATDELIARLKRQGYTRTLVEAPTIVQDLPATLTLQDGQVSLLEAVLSPDSIPGAGDDFAAPTYQWYKGETAIVGAVGATYAITGGASTATNGAGQYHVVVSNAIGSVTSATVTVSPETTSFATNLQPSYTVIGGGTTTLSVVLAPAPITAPTYQWQKATVAGGPFVNVSDQYGGKSPSLLVIGGEAPPAGSPTGTTATGIGFYRLEVTTSKEKITSAVAQVVSQAPTGFAFSVNTPRFLSVPLTTPGTGTISATVVNGGTPTYQWYKAPLSAPTAFVQLDGSTSSSLQVSGTVADTKGPGVYRLVATSSGASPTSITSVDTVVTTAP